MRMLTMLFFFRNDFKASPRRVNSVIKSNFHNLRMMSRESLSWRGEAPINSHHVPSPPQPVIRKPSATSSRVCIIEACSLCRLQLARSGSMTTSVDARRRDASKSMNFRALFWFRSRVATTTRPICMRCRLFEEFLWLSRIDFVVSRAAWHRTASVWSRQEHRPSSKPASNASACKKRRVSNARGRRRRWWIIKHEPNFASSSLLCFLRDTKRSEGKQINLDAGGRDSANQKSISSSNVLARIKFEHGLQIKKWSR